VEQDCHPKLTASLSCSFDYHGGSHRGGYFKRRKRCLARYFMD